MVGCSWWDELQAARRSPPRRSGGTRTSVLDSRPPLRRFRGPTSVCSSHTTAHSRTQANLCTFRQEVPLHRRCLYPWPHLDRSRCLHEDDPHHHHPPRLPPLHPQIQYVPFPALCARLALTQRSRFQTVTRSVTRTLRRTYHQPSV